MSMKNYVKALLNSSTKEEVKKIYETLKPIEKLAQIEKYKLIISSPIISNEEKFLFVKSILNIDSIKVENLLKLLIQNSKFDLLSVLVKNLNEEICNSTLSYHGVICSNSKLSSKVIKDIEEKLSVKTGKNIFLSEKVSDNDGIKVFVDVLNLEISISNRDIKDRLIDSILKAI